MNAEHDTRQGTPTNSIDHQLSQKGFMITTTGDQWRLRPKTIHTYSFHTYKPDRPHHNEIL